MFCLYGPLRKGRKMQHHIRLTEPYTDRMFNFESNSVQVESLLLNCNQNWPTFVSNIDPCKTLKSPFRVAPYTYYSGSLLNANVIQFQPQINKHTLHPCQIISMDR